MKCNARPADLSAYLDGELPPEASDAVRAHLAECRHCRDEYRAAEETVRLLHAIPRVPAPESLAEDVVARLRAERTPRRAARVVRILWPAAAAACIALALFYLYPPKGPRAAPRGAVTESPPRPPSAEYRVARAPGEEPPGSVREGIGGGRAPETRHMSLRAKGRASVEEKRAVASRGRRNGLKPLSRQGETFAAAAKGAHAAEGVPAAGRFFTLETDRPAYAVAAIRRIAVELNAPPAAASPAAKAAGAPAARPDREKKRKRRALTRRPPPSDTLHAAAESPPRVAMRAVGARPPLEAETGRRRLEIEIPADRLAEFVEAVEKMGRLQTGREPSHPRERLEADLGGARKPGASEALLREDLTRKREVEQAQVAPPARLRVTVEVLPAGK